MWPQQQSPRWSSHDAYMIAFGRIIVRAFLGVIMFALALSALVVFSLAAMYSDRRVAT